MSTRSVDRSAVAREKARSAVSSKKDRSALCTYTFADGRCCRTPRHAGHSPYCFFHARKLAQARAAEEFGRDIAAQFSSAYLSANDLSFALGRLFAAAAQGQVKPKTAATLAYLGQVLLQTIRLAQNEFINSCGADFWRAQIRSSVSRAMPAPLNPAAKPPAPPSAAPPPPQPQPQSQSVEVPESSAVQPSSPEVGCSPESLSRSEPKPAPPAPSSTSSTPPRDSLKPSVPPQSSAPPRTP